MRWLPPVIETMAKARPAQTPPALQDALLVWYAAAGRRLPWRSTTDPYRILVSEVMLQQTQVARVVARYQEWLTVFPGWQALADAPRQEVLQRWIGLGYNHRAIRLHRLARIVRDELDGRLPGSEQELCRLPGIGPYTAGAIQVFARNLPGRCLDVNTARIITRLLFARAAEPSRRQVSDTLLASFPAGRATDWGNALMDLGNAICTPDAPGCERCPVNRWCRSCGPRPGEQAERARRRQSPFLLSNRWWRGRVLQLLSNGPATQEELARWIEQQHAVRDQAALAAAIGQLRQEGIIGGDRSLAIESP